jgi:FkbH-like protein
LICLCSKNNAPDVDEVLKSHPHSVLRDEHVIVKKVNWDNKVANLKAIAKELNIGLDSLVFVDDSDFEVTAVRSQLPMVRTFQVPKNVFDYPAVFRQIRDLFVAGGVSTDGLEKTKQYKLRSQALDQAVQFENQDDYLRSLELKVAVNRDQKSSIKRIAELSQKSNQFNLTTLRLTEAEVIAMMDDPKAAIYSLNVSDKFGDHGLTGIVVAKHVGETLKVENFLMSCRVIGRGIEHAIWKPILRDAVEAGCKLIEADFIRSAKNQQVEGFFDNLGVQAVSKSTERHHYAMPISDLKISNTDHVEVTYVG